MPLLVTIVVWLSFYVINLIPGQIKILHFDNGREYVIHSLSQFFFLGTKNNASNLYTFHSSPTTWCCSLIASGYYFSSSIYVGQSFCYLQFTSVNRILNCVLDYHTLIIWFLANIWFACCVKLALNLLLCRLCSWSLPPLTK